MSTTDTTETLPDKRLSWVYLTNISRSLFTESTRSQDPQRAAGLVWALWKWLPGTGADVDAPTRPTPVAQLELTEQQLFVLIGMSHGRTNAEIADKLYISEETVKTHARRLYRVIGARDRAHAVALGFRYGILK